MGVSKHLPALQEQLDPPASFAMTGRAGQTPGSFARNPFRYALLFQDDAPCPCSLVFGGPGDGVSAADVLQAVSGRFLASDAKAGTFTVTTASGVAFYRGRPNLMVSLNGEPASVSQLLPGMDVVVVSAESAVALTVTAVGASRSAASSPAVPIIPEPIPSSASPSPFGRPVASGGMASTDGPLFVDPKSTPSAAMEVGKAQKVQVPAADKKPPAGVPTDAQFFNGKWYRFYSVHIAWREARDKCVHLGGRLVVVPDAATLEFVVKLSGNATIWLGATDEKSKGNWTWTDGTPMRYKAWFPDQPDNAGGHQYYLRLYHGKWDDAHDDESSIVGYVCEWKDR